VATEGPQCFAQGRFFSALVRRTVTKTNPNGNTGPLSSRSWSLM